MDSGKIARRFQELQRENSEVFRFFREAGGTYILFGDHAKQCAQEFYSTVSIMKIWCRLKADDSPVMCLKINTAKKVTDIITSVLLSKLRNAEVYEWEPSTRDIKKTKSASPGNLIEFDEILQYNEESWGMAISVSRRAFDSKYNVGIALVATTLKLFKFVQYVEGNSFLSLEQYVNATRPLELIMYRDTTRVDCNKKISYLCEKAGVKLALVDKKFFRDDIANTLSRLRQLVGIARLNQVADVLEKSILAANSISALIAKYKLLTTLDDPGSYRIEPLNTQFMRLDCGAQSALCCFEKGKSTSWPGKPADRRRSLFGLLNHCKTPMGRRLLADWIQQPSIKQEEIEWRLDMVELFVNDGILREEFQTQLKDIKDAEKIFQKVKADNKKAQQNTTFQNLYDLAIFAMKIPEIINALEKYGGRFKDSLDKLLKPLKSVWVALRGKTPNSGYVDMIEYVFDENYYRETREFRLNSSIDPNLQAAASAKEHALESMQQLAERYNDMLARKRNAKSKNVTLTKAKGLKLKFGSYCLRLKGKAQSNERKILEKKTSGFELEQITSAAVLFTTDEFANQHKVYIRASNEYKVIETKLLAQMTSLCVGYKKAFNPAPHLIAKLDVLVAFAHVAMNAPEDYVRPRITNTTGAGRRLELVGARHPLLEMADISFIKNDVDMISGETHFQIITGPNMGGKSTYITMVGIHCLLAQIGCFVPAIEAEIPIFDSILCRVGAGDQQLKGISTFMAEMLESTAIVNESTPRSLVIIDELGRGTSTSEGLGLAQSISEYMVEKATFSLFATHFHELCNLESRMPGVKNKYVDAHVDGKSKKLKMIYKIKDGSCSKSFGIDVAKMAKFPDSVISIAESKVVDLEKSTPGEISQKSTQFSQTQTWSTPMENNQQTQDDSEFRMRELCLELLKAKDIDGDAQDNTLNKLHFQLVNDQGLKNFATQLVVDGCV